MTVKLELKPEIERGLLEQARDRGVSLNVYLEEIVSRQVNATEPAIRKLTAKEWSTQFDEWADSFPEVPPIPDEALSRENLYPDRF